MKVDDVRPLCRGCGRPMDFVDVAFRPGYYKTIELVFFCFNACYPHKLFLARIVEDKAVIIYRAGYEWI